MQKTEADAQTTVAVVIRAVENVRRRRKDESHEEWALELAPQLGEAHELIGGFGEGKALGRVVALATEFVMWQDLRQVGVDPESDPPWKVMQNDLMEPDCWADGDRRLRLLKMLKKLSHKLEELPGGAAPEGCATLIEFCEQRGVLADTLRHRLHRHNEQSKAKQRIKAVDTGPNQRQLYRLEDLALLLTDEERARS